MTGPWRMQSVQGNAAECPLGTMKPESAAFPRGRRSRRIQWGAGRDRTGSFRDGLLISLWHHGAQAIPQWSDCLSPRELDRARQYRSPLRRAQFVTGRMLAKRSLIEHQWISPVRGRRDACVDYEDIDILPDSGTRSGRPVIRVRGSRKPWSLSISHTDSWTAVGLCRIPGQRVGIDLVELEAALSVPTIWYSAAERRLIESSDRQSEASLILWSLKEALYKSGPDQISFVPADWSTELVHGQLRAFHQTRPYHAHTLIIRIPNRVVMSVAAPLDHRCPGAT